ncbi:efflux RND transporter permease subunit [Sporosarcina thermotolerans]|uniref:Efflux RND transporter permease subunit n=1 Tax=Sporosarcina thermotolerans TaxID=633404 RepID=A0AAW9A9I6_9BACL|nr:efflux RND transporter permease subunit [Sporosarcina thermotolerans]MDW0116575.1 efflux RND transporter permease subunit [Sporosarcina thermotolerans]
MKVLEFIVRKKVLVGLLSVLVVALGSFAVFKLDKEIMPSVGMDGAVVYIDAGDMAATDMERFITSPLEQRLAGIEGVEEIQSTTAVGSSTFNITIARGQSEKVMKYIETAVNETKAGHPEIREAAAYQFGVRPGYEFFMDLSGDDLQAMTAFAKDVLEPRLESLKEVQDVNLSGVAEQEVSIAFNREEMKKRGLDISQVAGFIAQANSEATLGELQDGSDASLLRWNSKFADIDDVKRIEIPTAEGFIQLKEIADVSLTPRESSSFVWKNDTKELVFIQVGRAANITQIDMAKAVRAEIQKMRDEGLVKGFTLNEMVAQADFVQESIDGVVVNILIGSVVAIAILLLFLRNVRATLIIAVSIPTSVLLTFLTVYVLGYSLNMLTLIGLGLGIGMMVDSSIVILESIYRQRELGISKFEAVLAGTKEVAGAVFASMLTTIVVFLPIGFIGGGLGEFMIILAIVVALTLISSVLVAFTLIPVLSENFLRYRGSMDRRKESRFSKGYNAIVSWIVAKRRRCVLVIALFFGLFAGSLLLVNKIPMTVMPDIFNRYSELVVVVETGVEPAEKERIARLMNDRLAGIEDVESSYVLDNGGSEMFVIVNMTKDEKVVHEQKEVNEQILRSLREFQETEPIRTVQLALSEVSGAPVQVMIKGEDFGQLQAIAEDFMGQLGKVEGIVGITNSMERTSEEKRIVLNEKAIADAGLSQLHVKQFIEQAFIEMPIGQMALDGENVPLIVSWNEKTDSSHTLFNLEIATMEGDKKLSEFLHLEAVRTPNEITHSGGDRFIMVSADIEGRDLGAINRDVQKVISEFNAPTGYSIDVAGDIEQQQQLMMEMLFVLGIALFLVYFVMAVQFNHLGHPLIVMSVIPMAVIGVIIGLFVTQMELNLLSGMGIIMLIGIVLNNAILLIDRTNQLRRAGMSMEAALVEAGRNRIRPIFMTTLTTVGGMVPLALASGASGNYQAPLATVLISGLLFATFITLLLIPSVYRLFTRNEKVIEAEKSRGRKRLVGRVVDPLTQLNSK